MRKTLVIFLSVLLTATLAACGNTGPVNQTPQGQVTDNQESQEETQNTESSSEVITLTLADQHPLTNPLSKEGTVVFMNKVEEMSEGKVQFDYFPGEQLGKGSQMLDLVNTGIADIAFVPTAYISDKLSFNDVASLPGAFNKTSEGSEALWEITQGILLEEYLNLGVRPLMATTLHPYPVFTVDKKIEEVPDWKGLKIRTTGGIQELVVATMGAAPLSIPAPELFTALERGTVDGGLLGYSSWPSYQIDSIAKYATTNVHLGSGTLALLISENIFQELPQDVQDILIQAGNETVQHLSAYLDSTYEQLKDEFSSEGVDMYELSEEQLEIWYQELEPVSAEWVQKMVDKGLPGDEILADYHEAKENGISWELKKE